MRILKESLLHKQDVSKIIQSLRLQKFEDKSLFTKYKTWYQTQAEAILWELNTGGTFDAITCVNLLKLLTIPAQKLIKLKAVDVSSKQQIDNTAIIDIAQAILPDKDFTKLAYLQ